MDARVDVERRLRPMHLLWLSLSAGLFTAAVVVYGLERLLRSGEPS